MRNLLALAKSFQWDSVLQEFLGGTFKNLCKLAFHSTCLPTSRYGGGT